MCDEETSGSLLAAFMLFMEWHHFRNSLTIFNLLHETIKSLCMCTGKWFYVHKLRKSESCVTRFDNAHEKERNSPFCCRNVLWRDRKKDSIVTTILSSHFSNLLAIFWFVKVGSRFIVIMGLQAFGECS